jgi:hypothetical protein
VIYVDAGYNILGVPMGAIDEIMATAAQKSE